MTGTTGDPPDDDDLYDMEMEEAIRQLQEAMQDDPSETVKPLRGIRRGGVEHVEPEEFFR